MLTLLLGVMLLQQWLQFWGDVVQGKLTVQALMQVVALVTPSLLLYLLPLVALLAGLFLLSRLHIEHERVIIDSAGVSEFRLLRFLSPWLFLLTLFHVLNYNYFAPTSVEKQYTLREKARNDLVVPLLEPGRFVEVPGSQDVVYVKDIIGDELQALFYVQKSDLKANTFHVITSKTANLSKPSEAKPYYALNLYEGRFFRGALSEGQLQRGEFDRFFMPILAEGDYQKRRKARGLTTEQLWQRVTQNSNQSIDHISQQEAQTTIYFRGLMIFMIPALFLWALYLGKLPQRASKLSRLMPAMLIFLLYDGSLILVRRALIKADLETPLWFWLIHGIFLVVPLLLLMRRNRVS